MTAHQLAEAPLQSPAVERPCEPDGGEQIVDALSRSQAFEEPEAPLGEREGGRACHGDGPKGRRHRARRVARRLLDAPCERGEGWRLEQRADRDFHTESPAHSRGHLHHQQGVSAQGEEVVGGADWTFSAQNLGPDPRQQLLVGRTRAFLLSRVLQVGRREREPVQLAAGRQRQLVEHQEGGGNERTRQSCL